MGWPFEHWDNGVCHFHFDRWKEFREQKEASYPHNEDHHRYCLTLITPRTKLEDVPVPPKTDTLIFGGGGERGHDIQYAERDFSVIFEPYPRWITPYQPEESWILFAEDKHGDEPLGERIVLYKTDYSIKVGNVFAFFRNLYWNVVDIEGGHEGPHPSPNKKAKKRKFHTLDDLT